MTNPIPLLEAIKTRVLLCDGAMGTQLQLAGIEPGGCGEAWNVEFPEKVMAIQAKYVAGGSDCLITNTFGGSPAQLLTSPGLEPRPEPGREPWRSEP